MPPLSRPRLSKLWQQLQGTARAAFQAAPHVERGKWLPLLLRLDGRQQRAVQLVRSGRQGPVRMQQEEERYRCQALLQGGLQGCQHTGAEFSGRCSSSGPPRRYERGSASTQHACKAHTRCSPAAHSLPAAGWPRTAPEPA